MDEVKACFSQAWDKAAYQCQLLKSEIENRYPTLTVVAGKGALESTEITENITSAGAPDLFIFYGQRLICAIEVTGSDKVSNPWQIWIGAHKVSFAERATYPIGFFFYFGKNNQLRYFTSYEEIRSVLEPAETKTIRGLNFEYHILDNLHFKGESAFWDWFYYCLQIFKETEL